MFRITKIQREDTPIKIIFDPQYCRADGTLIPIKVYRQGSAVHQHWTDCMPKPTVHSKNPLLG